ncbi:hypothetical protein PVL29_018244 [Vitis rotundifolia]|uniref:DUF4283 domain-containing protein n=1 Tax=Vitis rotundifolia TaxID=103349 RepID=A0AA39DFM8_VITRO|nr:hypothetical protein PVL29_018244 [Vitis rotundifolia]
MVRTVKVFVERKTFLVRLEGDHGGTWCSIAEHSRGSVFVLGFEKEAVGWMIEHLTKAIEMKSHMGFNRKFRGKCCVHLMEIGFNDNGRFLRISEFANNRKYAYLIIPEGEKGRGWENIKSALSSMMVVPSSKAVEKGRQYRGENFSYNHVDTWHRSFAKVVSGEKPRGGGLVPDGRWARAVVCDCNEDQVKWGEVGRAVARKLGKKGIVSIVPFSSGKGIFFVESTEEAIFLQNLRKLRVEERKTVQLRRWTPKENSKIEGKFRGGWIELRGKARVRIAMKDRLVLPALLEVTDRDWVFTVAVVVVGEEADRRGNVKGKSTREALASNTGTGGGGQVERIRSTAGGSCRLGEDNKTRKGGERGKAVSIPGGTRGKGVLAQSLPSLNSNKIEDGPGEKKEVGGDGAEGDEASTVEGGRAFERKAQPLSKTLDKVGCSFSLSGLGLSPREEAFLEKETSVQKGKGPCVAGKGKTVFGCLEAQSSSPAKKKTTIGSKKLWSILLPPSPMCRQSLRCRSEPVLSGKDQPDNDENPIEEALRADLHAVRGPRASPHFSRRFPRLREFRLGERASTSRNKVATNIFSSVEGKEGLLGRQRSDFRGSAVLVLPFTPKIRGKRLRFLGNCGLSVAENLEVIPSSPSQSLSSLFLPSCGLIPSFVSPSAPNILNSDFQSLAPLENRVNSVILLKNDDDGTVGQNSVGIPNLEMVENQIAYPNQSTESVNPLSPKTIPPSNLATVSQGVTVGSPLGEFQIEGLSPRKMAKVHEVLKTLDIKVYSRRKSRCSSGL